MPRPAPAASSSHTSASAAAPSSETASAATGPGINPGNGIPLYTQLAGLFRHKVLTGQWPAGHQLDNLDQLAAQYQVARVTVRQAVARLVDEGLVSSHRGRGTRVLDRQALSAPPWADIVGGLEPGEGIAIDIVRKQRVAHLPDEFLGSYTPFASYVEICTVHAKEGMPFALMRVFVADEVYRLLPAKSLAKSKILSLIVEHAPGNATLMRQRMTVEPADIATASSLNYAMGSPIARILRQVRDNERRLSYTSMSWYRGDCFETDVTLPLSAVDLRPARLRTP